MRFPPIHDNFVRIMQGRQRTQMRQFFRQGDVVYRLSRAHPHMHIRRAVAGGLSRT